jgi:phosphosulfolactate synthase
VTRPTPADFLNTPRRGPKPRATGLTHLLDKGIPLATLQSYMPSVAGFIDIWKFGWGTAYIDPQVVEKTLELRRHGIRTCTGGTFLEIAWQQGRAAELFDWSAQVGFTTLEVSNGSSVMSPNDKRSLISEASRRGFEVLAEVGSKDPLRQVPAEEWVAEMLADLDAGATLVVAEGRESGTVGLYEPDGGVRTAIIDAIEAGLDGSKVIYEAPHRDQQAWLIRNLGPQVNVGNIGLGEVMNVESLRLGLRADTIGIAERELRGSAQP